MKEEISTHISEASVLVFPEFIDSESGGTKRDDLHEDRQDAFEKGANWAFKNLVKMLSPTPNESGLRRLPRDPYDPSKFLPVFKTENHTYRIIGEDGIGIERFTMFKKFAIQRGFARSFAQINEELNNLKFFAAKEKDQGKLVSEIILKISGLQDGIHSFSKEQFDSALWMSTLFIIREGQKITEYSEIEGEEMIRDWKDYGYSELDFFFLSGQQIAGYGAPFKKAILENEKAKESLVAAILTEESS